MTKYEVTRSEDEAIKTVKSFLNGGYDENEIVVVSKEKLETDYFKDSEVQHTSTKGTFSDKFMSFFIGEDAEEAVLTRFDFSEEEKEDIKQDIRDKKIIVIGDKYDVQNGEFSNHTPSKNKDKHAPTEHKGDIE